MGTTAESVLGGRAALIGGRCRMDITVADEGPGSVQFWHRCVRRYGVTTVL